MLGSKAIRLEDEDPFTNLYRAAHSGQTSIAKPTDPVDCVLDNAVIIYIGHIYRQTDRQRVGSFMNTTSVFTI